MVDVSHKNITLRTATARGRLRVPPAALQLLRDVRAGNRDVARSHFSKGDPLIVAQLAAISAAKRTSDLITLCHPALPVTQVEVILEPDEETSAIVCEATVRCVGRTGVEMEVCTFLPAHLIGGHLPALPPQALTAVNVGLLNGMSRNLLEMC